MLLGLVVTLATVLVYSCYISRQITGLRQLQTDLTDRNRRDSLQLLRIQGDLNQLALAMRDMLDPDETYPIAAWSSQFDRIRTDLDDALRQQEGVAVARRTPEQSRYLASAVAQFWDAASRIFELARQRARKRGTRARSGCRCSRGRRPSARRSRGSSCRTTRARRRRRQQVQEIYGSVQRQVRWFTFAALVAIATTSVFLIRSNQRLFTAARDAVEPAPRARRSS